MYVHRDSKLIQLFTYSLINMQSVSIIEYETYM